jgi:hypothetical protein
MHNTTQYFQVVESYEAELIRLRKEAAEAHAAARQELLRRKQLEEDMKRMLLKNITAMNFEALALFQQTTAVEQQQATGELRGTLGSVAQNQNLNLTQNDSFFHRDDDEMPRRGLPTPSAPVTRGPLIDATNGAPSYGAGVGGGPAGSRGAGGVAGVVKGAGRVIAGSASGSGDAKRTASSSGPRLR